MAQMKLPDEPTMYATQYRTLLGVDYQRDVTDVDKTHSPDMVNMISDLGGNPVKRPGYRELQETKSTSTTPNNPYIYFVKIMEDVYGIKKIDSQNNKALIINKVAFENYEVKEIKQVMNMGLEIPKITIKKILKYKDFIYILMADCFVRVNVTTGKVILTGFEPYMMSNSPYPGNAAPVCEEIIPLTTFSITNPEDGTGGETLYGKNLLSIYQQCSYVLNDPKDGSTQKKTKFKIPGYTRICSYVKVEVMDSNGVWQETKDFTKESMGTATGHWAFLGEDGTTYEDANITYNTYGPTITLNTPPSYTPVTGQDNVRITFAPFSMEQWEGKSGIYKGVYNENFMKMFQSDAFYIYNTRLFIGVENKAYYSEAASLFRVPDNSWFEVDNTIMAFARMTSNLSVITDGAGENTIYIATESTETVDSTTGETETTYSIKPSNSGVGAINGKCTGSLNDEPLFLTKTGVYGILTNYLSDKYAVSRSARINRKLCKEKGIEDAVGVSCNGYFYIAVNHNMYILDSRHKDSIRGNETSYECYFFNGLPRIKEMFVVDDIMFFSDGDTVYRWNDDLPEASRYYDNAHQVTVTKVEKWLAPAIRYPDGSIDDGYRTRITYSDGTVKVLNYYADVRVDDKSVWTGTPVCCKWCSTFDDDGAPQKLKTLNKKGTMVTVAPHAHSSVELTLIKDGNDVRHLGIFETDMLSFERIDLTRFTFNSNDVVADVFPKKKMKKYKRLQFVLENNRAEPFGITNVVKTYTVGNYAKR